MPQLLDTSLFSVIDADSSIGVGWRLNFYIAGTSTRKNTYPTSADASAGTNANANPVVIDADGRLPAIWLADDADYKGILTDENDVVKQTIDQISGPRFSASTGSSLIGFIQSGTGAVSRTVQAKLRDLPTPRDFGVDLEATSQGIGANVLRSVTTGVHNTGFGYHALQDITDGSENTAFGYLALSSAPGGIDPAGDYNTAFGSFALASVTTGYKNTGVGRAAADNLTTGFHNASFGYGSMHWATTAVNCVAVGFEAVHGGTSGPVTAQGLVGVGFHALYSCLTGDFNTAVGTSALAFVTTGARNTAIGTNALNQLVSGNDNIGIGYGAGLNNTGSGNIFIGVGADSDAGRANVTVIGTGITATADNTLYLGAGQAILPGTSSADFGSQAHPWNFGIFGNSLYAMCGTAMPAGGSAGKGLLMSSTTNFGVFFGSGAPTLTAAKGSLYLRSDGSSTSTRMYVNTDNGTTWTAVTTAA